MPQAFTLSYRLLINFLCVWLCLLSRYEKRSSETGFPVSDDLLFTATPSSIHILCLTLLLTFKDYSGLTLNQHGVASPCRTVCGFVALSCFKVNPLYIRTEADSLPIPDKPAQPIAVSVRAEGMESKASKQYPHTAFLKEVV